MPSNDVEHTRLSGIRHADNHCLHSTASINLSRNFFHPLDYFLYILGLMNIREHGLIFMPCMPSQYSLPLNSFRTRRTSSCLSVRPARSRLLYKINLRLLAHKSSRYGLRLLKGILASRVSMIRSISVMVDASARRPASICPGNQVKELLEGKGKLRRATKRSTLVEDHLLILHLARRDLLLHCTCNEISPNIHIIGN